MIILALDTATNTGWACNTPSGDVESGVQRFDLRRGSSPGFRFLEFRTWLRQMIERVQPEVIVYEQAHHRGGAATELCVGFTTRVQEEAVAAGIEYRAVHTATLKWHATGSGNAGKGDMVQSAMRRWQHYRKAWTPESDPGGDEADALCMLAWALDGFPERETKRKPTRLKAAA